MFFIAAFMLHCFLVAGELRLRRLTGQAPKNYRELWALLSKRTTSHKPFTALAFALFTVLSFCFWEAALRLPLDFQVPWWSGVMGLLAGGFLLFRRFHTLHRSPDTEVVFRRWNKMDFLLLWVVWGMCWGPWMALLCAPWIFVRVKRYINLSTD